MTSLFSAQMRLDSLGLENASERRQGRAVTHAQTDCRIYLLAEPDPAAGERVAAAAAAADVACCLILPYQGSLVAAAARPIVTAAQGAGVAALIANDAGLARALGADGVHLSASRSLGATYAAARQTLGRDGIIGADVGVSRHDAMLLAEAGAAYVAFGAPAHLSDRSRARERRDELIMWWGEIFEVACVALDVDQPEEAERLARAGADFVAVTLPAGQSIAKARDSVVRIGAVIGAGANTG
jgi:thiamine-phosphate pyrophosphorylase